MIIHFDQHASKLPPRSQHWPGDKYEVWCQVCTRTFYHLTLGQDTHCVGGIIVTMTTIIVIMTSISVSVATSGVADVQFSRQRRTDSSDSQVLVGQGDSRSQ